MILLLMILFTEMIMNTTLSPRNNNIIKVIASYCNKYSGSRDTFAEYWIWRSPFSTPPRLHLRFGYIDIFLLLLDSPKKSWDLYLSKGRLFPSRLKIVDQSCPITGKCLSNKLLIDDNDFFFHSFENHFQACFSIHLSCLHFFVPGFGCGSRMSFKAQIIRQRDAQDWKS